MRRLIALLPTALLLGLGACGGGDSVLTPMSPTQPGGGSGSNTATITVDSGPAAVNGAVINIPYVTVTICNPGTSTCQTIDHIEIDTGSYGLRVISSVLNSALNLPQETDASGAPVVECAIFADGISWGPVKKADIKIAGEAAAAVPMQVIGDPAFAGIPSECSSHGTAENTVKQFGANGILGVGPFIEDAGDYYICPQGVCAQASLSAGLEVSNPVAFFPADNNGVIVEMPSVPAAGATALSGSLVFGIGTRSNNGLGTATVFGVDPNFGDLSVSFNGQTFGQSFIDSGSNAIFFVDSAIPVCSSGFFFCPSATLDLMATITGANGATGTENFSVANATDLFATDAVALVNLGAPQSAPASFDFGLPFFFGRSVYTAIAGDDTPGGPGPYVAF